ncbi:trypsin-like peptidase domain-containing protein [Actinoplanes sp. HUAS TT8]|uniref:VMAP-C domain-containing protein n=1 Tax=Actinoplanes sp. HUAS TT8 TaxID=3447453 RepID=UPI003F5256A7
MTDPQDDFVRLVRRCLVRIDTADGGAGSGFWIAPGLVLTCAHVAPQGTVTVTWQSHRLTGKVRQASPPRRADLAGSWPYPDVALISVPGVDNDCVWLSEQNLPINAPLFLIGHSAVYAPDLQVHSASGKLAGTYGDDAEFWRFTGDEIAPGMSGGPVLDLTNGTVCGMVKTSRDVEAERGGLLVPIRALDHLDPAEQAALWEGHDRFHAAGSWTEVRHRRTVELEATRPAALLAQEEAGLFDLLSRLSGTPDLIALYAEAVGPATGLPPEPITSIRRLGHLLADRPAGRPGQLHPLLRLTDRLARAESSVTGAALHEWTVRVAARRGEYGELEQWRRTPAEPGRHRAGERPSIIVRVDPHSLDHTRYNVTLWVHQTGKHSRKVYCDDGLGQDLAGTRATITEQLRSLLKRLEGRAGVEFVVPAELFEEDFEDLAVTRYSRLGRTNPVVIRDLERFTDSISWSSWKERWRALHTGTGSTEWLACTDQHSEPEFDAGLRLSPEIALLGLARQPRQFAGDTLGVAIGVGIPAAVWSRNTCPEHQADEAAESCSGHRFRHGLSEALAGHRLADLPDVVQRLRNEAAAGREPMWAGIVLLWDDPEHNPEPAVPLVELA